MAREVYNGISLAPQVIEKVKKFTNYCPNLYFGTPEYPIPPVSCGLIGCRFLEEGCKKIPGLQIPPDGISRAIKFVIRRQKSFQKINNPV